MSHTQHEINLPEATAAPEITILYLRHPSYPKMVHPTTQHPMCPPKDVALEQVAHRQIAEVSWLYLQNQIEHGTGEQANTWEGIYSAPAVRSVLGCLALPPGILPLDPAPAMSFEVRREQKANFYRSLNWDPEDSTHLPHLVDRELQMEKIAHAYGVRIIDPLHELLELPPRLVGASSDLFRNVINRSHYPRERVDDLLATTRDIVKPGSEQSSRNYLFMTHGSTMVFLRKYAPYLLQGDLPGEATALTYEEIKYQTSIEDLSYHGCGLILRYNADGQLRSQTPLSIQEALKEDFDYRKSMAFLPGNTSIP